MSLDVYLNGKTYNVPCICGECGHEHERQEIENFFSANITHNLGKMAEAAGIYKHLWRPEEIGITKASQLIEPLESGITLMEAKPDHFKKFNAPNGWGLYEHFMPWLREYLEACKKYPDATINVSR